MRDACLSIDKVDWKLFSGTRKNPLENDILIKIIKKNCCVQKSVVPMHKMLFFMLIILTVYLQNMYRVPGMMYVMYVCTSWCFQKLCEMMPQIRGYLSEKSTLKQRRRHRLVLHKGTKSNVDSTQHKVFNKMYLVFVKAKDLQRLPQHFLHYFFVAHTCTRITLHHYILHVPNYRFFSSKDSSLQSPRAYSNAATRFPDTFSETFSGHHVDASSSPKTLRRHS